MQQVPRDVTVGLIQWAPHTAGAAAEQPAGTSGGPLLPALELFTPTPKEAAACEMLRRKYSETEIDSGKLLRFVRSNKVSCCPTVTCVSWSQGDAQLAFQKLEANRRWRAEVEPQRLECLCWQLWACVALQVEVPMVSRPPGAPFA